MGSLRKFLMIGLVWAGLAAGAVASGFTALARVDGASSGVFDGHAGRVEVTLSLSQPVPWRLFTLDEPRRLVVDFRSATWDGTIPVDSAHVSAARTGAFSGGWSRIVLDLAGPLAVSQAEMVTGAENGAARLEISLAPTGPVAFAASAGAPDNALFAAAPPPPPPKVERRGQGGVLVVLDPGHGGLDPGAEVEDVREADLMLTFARELREVLLRAGGFEVVMTRDEDVFLPLEHRISVARAAGGDVFLSLHADALPVGAGSATGATIYTLSEEASDVASARLAERHDASDLLAGIDLSGQGDEVALVLMELARTETQPRSDALARQLVDGITAAAGRMNHRPLRSAGFSVLKSPDIPSVLIEIGFLSSARDRERLTDPEWRQKAAEGIRDALLAWAIADRRLSGR